MWRYLLITILFGFSATSWAEKKEVTLEEITITATRIEEVVKDIPQDVTVITKKEIEAGSYKKW